MLYICKSKPIGIIVDCRVNEIHDANEAVALSKCNY